MKFKTANTLKSMVDPEIRKKRNEDLLKGEEMHQLARDINYGNQGKITGRDLIAQRNRNKLALAAIIINSGQSPIRR